MGSSWPNVIQIQLGYSLGAGSTMRSIKLIVLEPA